MSRPSLHAGAPRATVHQGQADSGETTGIHAPRINDRLELTIYASWERRMVSRPAYMATRPMKLQ